MTDNTSVHQESLAFLQQFHAFTDSLDASSLDQLYAKDALLQFNHHELKGFDAIRGFFEEQFSKLKSMKHTITHFGRYHPYTLSQLGQVDLVATCPETVGDTIYQAADITYMIKGDPEAVPILIHGMANYFRKPVGAEEEGKIARFKVYLDSLPLVKRMEEVTVLGAK